MIFIKIEHETVLQIGDKTRIDTRKSFGVDEVIEKVEIKPSDTTIFLDCTLNGYLDWLYSNAETITGTVRINDVYEKTFTIEVITDTVDALYSTDNDLVVLESDIIKYVRDGRFSFIDIHREAKKRIDQYLAFKNYTADVTNVQEIKDWSKHLTLQMIYEGLSNAIDDIFAKKADKYSKLVDVSKKQTNTKLDLDNDGASDTPASISSIELKIV